MSIATARSLGPRWWLVASLVLVLWPYLAAGPPERPASWIAVALFLVVCVWRGSRRALGWYRLLQTVGLVLVTFLWAMALLTDNVTVTGPFWPLLPYALSVWCAYAPALTDHVGEPDHRQDQHQPS